MLFHISIDARDPRRVAEVLAELMGGRAVPFPPVEGGWIALADDDRNTAIEVYPLGTLLIEIEGDADAGAYVDEFARWQTGSATHFALATPLSLGRVMALALRQGWSAKYRKRSGQFGSIELWLENLHMVELLTVDMQAEYLASLPPAVGAAPAREIAPIAARSSPAEREPIATSAHSRNWKDPLSVFAW